MKTVGYNGATVVDDGSVEISELYGDVVATAVGTGIVEALIANNAVSFAKMQNISGGVLLGRDDGSAGDIEEISLGTGLSMSSNTLNAQVFDPDTIVCAGGAVVVAGGNVVIA